LTALTASSSDVFSIIYTLATSRSRNDVSAQQTVTPLIHELTQRVSKDEVRDRAIGRTLYQLLIPQAIQPAFTGSSEMLLAVDAGTASIPWELLERGEADEQESPWAIRTKLLRMWRSSNRSRSQVAYVDHDPTALVIGEPESDTLIYPRLAGARQEAIAVAQTLASLGTENVLNLISDTDVAAGPTR
jgi:hypothetical protein